MILLIALLHFACVIAAGRRLLSKTGKTLGFLAGLMLGPVGVIIVYQSPELLSSKIVDLLFKKFENNGQISERDLLDFAGVTSGNRNLEAIKKRQMTAGFKPNRVYAPLTGSILISFLIGSVFYGSSLLIPVVYEYTDFSIFKESNGIIIQEILAFLLFFIPFLLSVTNHRNIIVCPRCAHSHKLASSFEKFLGIVSDVDPTETGCSRCDYLPSRDRKITIE
ncbi:MAG: hypothetical protein K9N06_12030 [Candidatus Cloacimonetes bacterium]|nr:hypothetical protein [Candidatus Cloacimonadota bacterium]